MNRRDFLKTSVFGTAALSLSTIPGCNIRIRNEFDTIIKGGLIFTGDGKAPLQGDIAISEGKIAAIGKNLGKRADSLLDAHGMVVSPGFIDIHTHTDTNLFDAPKGDSRIFQGITSEVGGNCGYCPFVYSDQEWEKRKDIPRNGGKAWRNIDGFYERLQDNKIGINYSSLVGHGDIREAVVGPYNVKATDSQIRKMCEILDEQLSMGAIGLSYGLEYAPGCYSNTEEMVELNKVVARHNALYTIHMRNEDDHVLEAMDEAIEAAKLSGARLEISHLKAQNPANFEKIDRMLSKIDEARAGGIDIAFDRYPYTAFSTGFTSFIPIELRDGTDEDIYRRLYDKAACEKMKKYALGRIERFGGPQQVLVAACANPDNAKYAGKSLTECCSLSGMDEWEMIRYLLISEKLLVNQATFAMKEENLRKIYAHPLSMPASDGSVYSPEGVLGKELPHPRSYGTFAAFFEKFVREEKILDMAAAIHKCTGLPASRAKFRDRGLLIPGYAADVVVFDPQGIADKSTYAAPHTFPSGIKHVFVNGVWTIKDGLHTGALAGKILQGSLLGR